MKKIFALLTGIVLLVAVLVTCGGRDTNNQEDRKPVFIYLKAVEQDGAMHLLMRDSNNPNYSVIDDLITIVRRGDNVVWMRDAPHHGIRKIDQIHFHQAVKGQGLIFSPRPTPGDTTIIIPQDAGPGAIKYSIIFTDKNGTPWSIDPHLIIPPDQ